MKLTHSTECLKLLKVKKFMVHGREFCTLTTLKRNNFNILHVHILCCTQLILSSIIHSFIQTFKTWLMTTTNSSHGSYS